MGFGHRVYKNYDPRARIMQKTMYEVLEATGHGDDPLMKVALELEKIALNDPTSSRRSSIRTWTSFGHHAACARLPHDHVHTFSSRSLAPSAGSLSGTK